MLRFGDYKYERPDMEAFEKKFYQFLKEFDNAETPEAQDHAFGAINRMRNEFKGMKSLAFIRHSQNVADEFYNQENEFMGVAKVKYQELVTKLYKALVGSRFRKYLEDKWGKHIFVLAENFLNLYSPEIAEYLEKENELSDKYYEIIATTKIPFQGEERNFVQLMSYIQNKDRAVRKGAQDALASVYARKTAQLDQLFDELVKIRHKIALALGYDNFLDLGYARRGRVDITPDMIKTFRDQVHQHVVPIVQNLRHRQAVRLGLSSLTYYDEGLDFLTGNARPKGSIEDILNNAGKMYAEMSPETNKFFKFLRDSDLLDVLSRDNKFQMVYCEFVANYKLPLVFANFNGTADDVESITHEAGHGFQFYCSKEYELPEYYEAPSDISEVHSMSMELFAWPWLELFFGDEKDKYMFSHLDTSLKKVTLFTIADEFQEWVYTNPQAAPQERTKVWREIERKYWPHRDYGDNQFLDQGGYWYRYGNIFQDPLYMIDYALAQLTAYQFFAKARVDWNGAWNDYVKLCKAGGSDTFINLLKTANLKSPFEEGSVETAIRPIQDWLDRVYDTNF